MMTTAPKYYPMFEDHEISWLAERLMYSEYYLMSVKYRQKPLTGMFRRRCAKLLSRTEAQLFGDQEAAS